MKRLPPKLLVLVLVLVTVLATAGWGPAVPGPVDRGYEPPVGPFGPGHRGVDLRAEPGSEVKAGASGTVSFAGPVAGAFHVTVSHPGNVRITYAYLAGVSVAEGDPVKEGTVVGTSGGRGPAHDGEVVHVGARVAGVHVDPGPYLGASSRRVRLVPLDGGPRGRC